MEEPYLLPGTLVALFRDYVPSRWIRLLGRDYRDEWDRECKLYVQPHITAVERWYSLSMINNYRSRCMARRVETKTGYIATTLLDHAFCAISNFDQMEELLLEEYPGTPHIWMKIVGNPVLLNYMACSKLLRVAYINRTLRPFLVHIIDRHGTLIQPYGALAIAQMPAKLPLRSARILVERAGPYIHDVIAAIVYREINSAEFNLMRILEKLSPPNEPIILPADLVFAAIRYVILYVGKPESVEQCARDIGPLLDSEILVLPDLIPMTIRMLSHLHGVEPPDERCHFHTFRGISAWLTSTPPRKRHKK